MNNNAIAKEIKLIGVYGRVSTSAQEVQETIEAQLLEVHKFASERGYAIVKEYLDRGWSGDILARPALDELRLDAKKHIWDAILIYDPDRLGRRYFYQELVMDELKQLDIETLFVTVPPVKDLNDRMMGGIRGLFAEYERAKISERFRMGKVNRVSQGHVLLSEAPYGYDYILNAGKKGTAEYVPGHFKVKEDEAEIVRMMFKWVADEGFTLRKVVRELHRLHIKPRKSKRGVWNTSTLSTLLRNQTYITKAHWNASYAVIPENPLKDEKYKKIKKTSRKMRPISEWMPLVVPRIIEDELFHRTGRKLRDNFANTGRNKKNPYLIAGKIWCVCGRRRTGEGGMSQYGIKHLYYRCTDRVYCFPLPRTCKVGGINAKISDDALWYGLKEFMSTPALMKDQIRKFMDNLKNDAVGSSGINIERTKLEISKLQEREKKYTNICSEGIISIEKLKEYVAPLKKELELLEADLVVAYAEQKPKSEVLLPTEEEIELFAKEATEALGDLNFEAKKAIISKADVKIFSNQTELQVHGSINLNELHVAFFSKYSDEVSATSDKLPSNHVESFTEHRNRGFAQCWEIHTV